MMCPVAVHDRLAGHFARMDPDVPFFYALVPGNDLGALRINQLFNRVTREIAMFKALRAGRRVLLLLPRFPRLPLNSRNCLPSP